MLKPFPMSSNSIAIFKDIPNRVVSPVTMHEANESILIYNGEFKIKNELKEYKLSGKILFKWFPDMSVKFKGEFLNAEHIDMSMMETYDVVIDDKITGKVKIMDIDFTGAPICGGDGVRFIWGDSTVPVNEVAFAIPNLRDYLGGSVKDETESGLHFQKTRLTLDDKPYKIIIDKLIDYKEQRQKLENDGGYILLYAGKVTKNKGSISLADLHKWHDRFHHFLYFLNGRRTAPMFYTGLHEGKPIWTDYSDYTVDLYKETISWSDIMFLNDLPQLWKKYNELWKKELDKDFLISAIHWYVEANSNAGMIEGSIILIQTALELLYNWLIIENQKIIIGSDADSLSAANKIRLLIFQFKISPSIPPAFTELAKVPDMQDGPEAFVSIRNALVHGQAGKREKLMKINLKAKYQALQLGIWYVELALLFILDYRGNYRNRTNGQLWRNTGEKVPWAESSKGTET